MRGEPIGKSRREGEHRSVLRRSRQRRFSNSTKASVNARAHSWSRCARKRSDSRTSSSTEEYRASPTPTAHAGRDDKRHRTSCCDAAGFDDSGARNLVLPGRHNLRVILNKRKAAAKAIRFIEQTEIFGQHWIESQIRLS
ncbi:zinc knuckle [Colletotrichum limetticola]|uniref:Zinc knuckle n=1 Tax=Colletotrichum limetticola TaxID=1209924 RepID=A0ABQ9PFR9_9PEZI|nr:zinc knuckle [Colletotrichum limetticola]